MISDKSRIDIIWQHVNSGINSRRLKRKTKIFIKFLFNIDITKAFWAIDLHDSFWISFYSCKKCNLYDIQHNFVHTVSTYFSKATEQITNICTVMGVGVPLDSFTIICSNLERHYFWLGTDSFATFYFSIFNKKFISIFRWRIWFISYIIWRYISRLFKDNTIAQWRHLEITFIGRHGRVADKNLRFNGL